LQKLSAIMVITPFEEYWLLRCLADSKDPHCNAAGNLTAAAYLGLQSMNDLRLPIAMDPGDPQVSSWPTSVAALADGSL
jgi:hypothetical protein